MGIVQPARWIISFLICAQLKSGDCFVPTKSCIGHTVPNTASRNRRNTGHLLQSTVDQEQDDNTITLNSNKRESPESSLRPFHQNWWPVAAVTSLQKDRPNAIQVLGKSLVVFHDGSSWRVLDDLCSHRFAPLSEGRVITTLTPNNNSTQCHLQCAYHGWEFNSQGTCTRVPQEPNKGASKARPVQAYAVREAIHMVWVWMDPETTDTLGDSVPLPIHHSLHQAAESLGPHSCFQRDLPYGMEILGENLLDLSHLPFAHHSVGFLDREQGGYLPLRMLSKQQRLEEASKEYEKNAAGNATTDMAPIIPIPTFQAEVVDAAQYDPILMRQAKASGDVAVTKSWTTTIGYFGPSHVRYRRDRGDQGEVHVELFLCPTTEGKSRVFLFNVMVPGKQQPPVNTAKPHLGQKLWNNLKPSTWKQRMMKRILQNFFAGERGHLASHSIFDGDGIFLHKQGNRMKQAKKSYQDYSTPSSADILLNAYRRWLDQVAQKTRANGLDAVSQSVVGSNAYAADDDTARSLLLDRYNTHTKDCPLCLASLQQKRRQKARLHVLQTALQGATGASMTLFLVALAAAQASGVRLAPLLRALGFATAGTFGGSLWSRQQQEKLDKKINSFIFEDYIHAEKN